MSRRSKKVRRDRRQLEQEFRRALAPFVGKLATPDVTDEIEQVLAPFARLGGVATLGMIPRDGECYPVVLGTLEQLQVHRSGRDTK